MLALVLDPRDNLTSICAFKMTWKTWLFNYLPRILQFLLSSVSVFCPFPLSSVFCPMSAFLLSSCLWSSVLGHLSPALGHLSSALVHVSSALGFLSFALSSAFLLLHDVLHLLPSYFIFFSHMHNDNSLNAKLG